MRRVALKIFTVAFGLTLLIGGIFLRKPANWAISAQDIPQDLPSETEQLNFETATPVQPADFVPQSSVSSNEIESATNAYFTAVEAYRTQENRYSLARDQYYQLNTLAAQDEAIRRARDVLQARADVLLKYFSYLRLILMNTKGIDLNDKQAADTLLQQWQKELETYLEQVPAASDRQQINALFENLNGKSDPIQSAAYGTLILIKIGEIQTAVDTAALAQERTMQAVNESTSMSEANKEISRRGSEEISTLMQRARNNLFTLIEEYRESLPDSDFNESTYRAFQSNAEFSYVQLRQILDFLREIQKGLAA